MNYLIVFLELLLSMALVVGALAFSRLLAPRPAVQTESRPYECGAELVGNARVRFHAGYYLVALLFLVFDVEAAFLYPWAMAQAQVGLVGLIEIVVFISILLLALVYAWKKRVLEWL